MSKENVLKFEEQVLKDEGLQKKIEEAFEKFNDEAGGAELDKKSGFEAIAPIAKEAGFEFTYEEFAEAYTAGRDGELDIKEMEAVAGGSCLEHTGLYDDPLHRRGVLCAGGGKGGALWPWK